MLIPAAADPAVTFRPARSLWSHVRAVWGARMMTDSEFEAIWKSCFPRLVRYCQFRTATAEEAKDMAAEAFTRLLTQDRAPADPLPWLFRVATNLSKDGYRRAKRESAYRQSADVPPPQTQTWRDPDVWDAVRRLDRDKQLAVYLRLVEDLTFAQMGSLMGRSEAAAKMLYHRAVARLALALGAETDE